MIAGRTAVVATTLLLVAAAAVVAGPRRYVVDGSSMAPSLMTDDVVATGWLPAVDRFRRPERFERWVVETIDGDAVIKRLAGLPGELVELRGGDLLVDGRVEIKSPAQLAEVALPVAVPIDCDRGVARIPPIEVLDDVPFATEVNRPLEPVADVGIAALIRPGPNGSRARVELGAGRVVWRLPPGVACWLIAGRLDGRFVAVGWRHRTPAAADDSRGGLTDRLPAAWQVAVPWPCDRPGLTAAGGGVEVDAGGIIERIDLWRDVHLRPTATGEASWRLGADAYLMLGDFPTASIDSRMWGPQPRRALRHRVALRR